MTIRKIEGRKVETVDSQKVLPKISLADVLESIRDDLGLTKVAMSEKLGLSKGHYGNVVNGKEPVSVKRAAEWARILEYPEQQFVAYALQDLLKRNELEYTVELRA